MKITLPAILACLVVVGGGPAYAACKPFVTFAPAPTTPGKFWVCGANGQPQLIDGLTNPAGQLLDFHVNGANSTLSVSEDGTRVTLDHAWSCRAEDNHISCTRPKP